MADPRPLTRRPEDLPPVERNRWRKRTGRWLCAELAGELCGWPADPDVEDRRVALRVESAVGFSPDSGQAARIADELRVELVEPIARVLGEDDHRTLVEGIERVVAQHAERVAALHGFAVGAKIDVHPVRRGRTIYRCEESPALLRYWPDPPGGLGKPDVRSWRFHDLACQRIGAWAGVDCPCQVGDE